MSRLTDADKLAVAARFTAASAGNDADGYRALCAPDCQTWHNYDGLEVAAEQTARTIGWLHRTVPDLAWRIDEVSPTPNGFVVQMVMTGTAPGGPLSVATCAVVTLDDAGLITRIAEYLDPAQTAPLRG